MVSKGLLQFRSWIACSLAMTAALLAGSCQPRSAPLSSQRSLEAIDLAKLPGNVFQITFADHTVLVDLPTVRKTLRSVSKNGNVLVFDPSPQIQRLQPGSVLVMQSLTMRKVLAVMPFQSRIAVLTTS